MNRRYLIPILILIAGATWWVLRPDDEARVRQAHAELGQLLNKVESDTSTASILDFRALQNLFADICEVTGDADALAGTHSPEEMASTIVRVRELFTTIDLTFGELRLAFPVEGEAVAEFTAVLVAKSDFDEIGEVAETRNVTSRLRNVDGSWLFTGFHLVAAGSD